MYTWLLHHSLNFHSTYCSTYGYRRCVCAPLYSCVVYVVYVSYNYAVCACMICAVLNVIRCGSDPVASADLPVHSLSPTLCCHLLGRLLSHLRQSPLVLTSVHVCLLVFKLSFVQSLQVWSLVECDQSVTLFCIPISAS